MKVSQAKIRTPSSNLDRKIITKGSGKVTNVTNSDKKGEYYYLGVDQLIPFHNQARIYFDDEKISSYCCYFSVISTFCKFRRD